MISNFFCFPLDPEKIIQKFEFSAFLFLLLSSGYAFYRLYFPSQISHTKWQHKSYPGFPSVLTVKKEIVHTSKGVIFATLLPSLSIYLRDEKYMHCYCGTKPGEETAPFSEEIFRRFLQFLVVVSFTDFYEFLYHWIGHKFDFGWMIHKHHHHLTQFCYNQTQIDQKNQKTNLNCKMDQKIEKSESDYTKIVLFLESNAFCSHCRRGVG